MTVTETQHDFEHARPGIEREKLSDDEGLIVIADQLMNSPIIWTEVERSMTKPTELV